GRDTERTRRKESPPGGRGLHCETDRCVSIRSAVNNATPSLAERLPRKLSRGAMSPSRSTIITARNLGASAGKRFEHHQPRASIRQRARGGVGLLFCWAAPG